MFCPSTLMVNRGTLGNELAKWNPDVLGTNPGTILIVAMAVSPFLAGMAPSKIGSPGKV
jgi:hypothetical protein